MRPKPPDTFEILANLVAHVECKPGWAFRLQLEEGAMRLVITVPGVDAYNPKSSMHVSHYFPVPTATYNLKTWRRWIFECCRGVENHELGEWFRIGKERPFAPLHGPGENPYIVQEYRPESDAFVTQDGSMRERP